LLCPSVLSSLSSSSFCFILIYINFVVFFFNAPATTELYTLSLHDALPIWSSFTAAAVISAMFLSSWLGHGKGAADKSIPVRPGLDRKSTRLNSSHVEISYAVFCLKKKKRELKENHLSADLLKYRTET